MGAPGRLRPYDTGTTACGRRTAERERRRFHAHAPRGPKSSPRRASTHARGWRRTGARRALRPSQWGALKGAVGVSGRARRGPGGRTTLAFPLRTSSGVPGPRLPRTLGGGGERVNASGVVRLRACGNTCGRRAASLWRTGGTTRRALGTPCGPGRGAPPERAPDQPQCRAPGVDGKFRSWGEPDRPGPGVCLFPLGVTVPHRDPP